MQGALSGVRVLDFTEYVAGPVAGQILADMGAAVTKIEPPTGDLWRLTNPIVHGESRGFIAVNRGKRSVVIDLKTDEGRAIVHKAVVTADVVLTSYRPGVAQRLAMDYETLSALNPRLVYAANTAFGTTGPYADKAGFDLVAQAMSGIIAYESQQEPDKPRSITATAITDFVSGTYLGYGVVCALFQRERTGLGQRVDSSLFAAGLALQYRPLLSIEVMDRPGREQLLGRLEEARRGDQRVDDIVGAGYAPAGQPATATNPYYNIYKTRDGYMVIACLNNRLRRTAAEILGVEDPRVVPNEFDSTLLDLTAAGRLNQGIRDVFLTRSTADWAAAFEARGVPCGPVNLTDEIYDDPHVLAQGMILDLVHPVVGDIKMPNLPVRMSAAETGSKLASPALGQHTREFLEELAYAPDEIDRLLDAGVVRAWS